MFSLCVPLSLLDPITESLEVQPVSNMSTAADLLKQGAGEHPHIFTSSYFSFPPYYYSFSSYSSSYFL